MCSIIYLPLHLVPNIFQLEKYSSSLEQIVAERAEALAREKQKTESLISRLLQLFEILTYMFC